MAAILGIMLVDYLFGREGFNESSNPPITSLAIYTGKDKFKDNPIKLQEWKQKCDQAKKDVDDIVAKIRQL